MQIQKLQANIQCSHCGHKWNTKSKSKFVSCSACTLKTLNPQCTAIDMKPLYRQYVRDMKQEPEKPRKAVLFDYATCRAELEQKFIQLYQHTWTSEGGSIRPVGLKKMPSRELARYIDIAEGRSVMPIELKKLTNKSLERYVNIVKTPLKVVSQNAES